jgi:hypothetical protein
VVVASFASAWLAFTKVDPVVADDYYKLGLTINRRLPAVPDAKTIPAATLVIDAQGIVSVRLSGDAAAPAYVRLTLRRPGARDGDVMLLGPTVPGNWAGRVHDVGSGRQIVTLESDAWRLPVTLIDRLPATIRFGGPAQS